MMTQAEALQIQSLPAAGILAGQDRNALMQERERAARQAAQIEQQNALVFKQNQEQDMQRTGAAQKLTGAPIDQGMWYNVGAMQEQQAMQAAEQARQQAETVRYQNEAAPLINAWKAAIDNKDDRMLASVLDQSKKFPENPVLSRMSKMVEGVKATSEGVVQKMNFSDPTVAMSFFNVHKPEFQELIGVNSVGELAEAYPHAEVTIDPQTKKITKISDASYKVGAPKPPTVKKWMEGDIEVASQYNPETKEWEELSRGKRATQGGNARIFTAAEGPLKGKPVFYKDGKNWQTDETGKQIPYLGSVLTVGAGPAMMTNVPSGSDKSPAQAIADFSYGKSPAFQKIMRRTESVFDAVETAKEIAQTIPDYGNKQINQVTQAVQEAFGNMEIALGGLANMAVSDEFNQIMGGGQGNVVYFKRAEKEFSQARTLNQKMKVYEGALKFIAQRQLANIKGTPYEDELKPKLLKYADKAVVLKPAVQTKPPSAQEMSKKAAKKAPVAPNTYAGLLGAWMKAYPKAKKSEIEASAEFKADVEKFKLGGK